MTRIAYTGARIFDGEAWWDRSALVVDGDRIEGIIAADSPTDAQRVPMGGGILAPGFIDLQVNGAGGGQFNLTPDVATIETICTTFARFGTSACLPTLHHRYAGQKWRGRWPPASRRHGRVFQAFSAFTSKARISALPARARTTRR